MTYTYTLASPLYHVYVSVCVCVIIYAVLTFTTMVGVICFVTSMVTAGSSVQSAGC